MRHPINMTRWSRLTALIGISTAAICIIVILLAAELQLGYSHKHHTLSKLTRYTGPYELIVTITFAVYNFLLTLTGFAWLFLQRRFGRRSGTAASLIIVTGALGMILSGFPQDPDYAPMSALGIVHKVVAITMTLTALAAMLAQGKIEMARGQMQISLFTNATVVFVTIMGSLATVSIESDLLFGAVLERVTLAGFLTWIVVESIVMYNVHRG